MAVQFVTPLCTVPLGGCGPNEGTESLRWVASNKLRCSLFAVRTWSNLDQSQPGISGLNRLLFTCETGVTSADFCLPPFVYIWEFCWNLPACHFWPIKKQFSKKCSGAHLTNKWCECYCVATPSVGFTINSSADLDQSKTVNKATKWIKLQIAL